MTQSKTKIIGLTGGISTGKTTAAEIIKGKGFNLVDADKIAKEVLNEGHSAYASVVEYFGQEILRQDKSIDRKALGDKIFKDSLLREKLNSLTHPHIMKAIKKAIDENHKEQVLFLDIPLLLEVYDSIRDSEIFIDEIWLVYCTREEQVKRLMKRDKITREDAELKVNAQIHIEKKRELSDKVIDNTKDKGHLKRNIEMALEKIS